MNVKQMMNRTVGGGNVNSVHPGRSYFDRSLRHPPGRWEDLLLRPAGSPGPVCFGVETETETDVFVLDSVADDFSSD